MENNFEEKDTELFYSLFMDIRKYYNLFRKYEKNDIDAKIDAWDYILNDETDNLFFEEQMKHRNLKSQDLFIKY